jgi:hypothetical protein
MESGTLCLNAEAEARAEERRLAGSERLLHSLAECLLPSTEAVPRAAERVAGLLSRQVRSLSPLPRLLFFLGLRLLEWSPLFLFQAGSRLSRLPTPRRRELFSRWHHSRIYLRRQVATGYNGTIFLTFYDLPETRALLEYGVEPHVAACRKRRETLLAAQAGHTPPTPRGPSMIRS